MSTKSPKPSATSGVAESSSSNLRLLASPASDQYDSIAWGHKAVTRTSYPVVRRGRLVRAFAVAESGKSPRVFTEGQADKGLSLIHKRRRAFSSAIREAMSSAAIDELGLEFTWRERNERGLGGLKAAGPSRGLGAVYDFEEFAFSIGGALVVARACVTLCVLSPEEAAARVDKLPLSKFWVRFVLASHPQSGWDDQRPVDLSFDVLREFDQRCAKLAAKAVAVIAPLYAQVASEVLKEEIEVDFEHNGAFAVLAIGTTGGDFDNLFDATRAGKRLTEEVRRDDADVARRLLRLAFETIADTAIVKACKDIKNVDLAKAFDGRIRYILYESPSSYRGVFLARFDDNEARFVGFSHAPSGLEPEPATSEIQPDEVGGMSANQVSGGLVQEYALAF